MSLVGKSAPDFTLLDSARKAVSLGEQRGHKVVIAFFPAAFTGVCEKELCSFRDAMAALNELDARVLAISVDAPFSNAAFAQRNGLQFPVLSDYARTTVQAYGVAHADFAGMPGYTAAKRSVFVVAADGSVAWEWVAPSPSVEPDYEAVKAAVARA